MNIERINTLLTGYLDSTLSENEVNELLRYIKSKASEDMILGVMEEYWKTKNGLPMLDSERQDILYLGTINNPRFQKSVKLSGLKKISWPILKLVSAVAAVVLLIFGFHFYSPFQPEDVPPGRSNAVLILSDGRKINLDISGEKSLDDQGGTRIRKSSNGQLIYMANDLKKSSDAALRYNTLQTPRGGEYRLILPDGTKVWLNASSSIKYPTSFSSLKKREVTLVGEAYFEIAHNKAVPFHVISDKQEIEVLGTHFNVSCYADEPTVETTLLEGAVRLTDHSSKTVTLKPGQQAVVGHDIRIKDVDTEIAVAWKNGDFILKGENFGATMRKISRWYDVEVIYGPSAPTDLQFGGWVSRSKNISAVLKIMESTGKVHFKVEGRRVMVTK